MYSNFLLLLTIFRNFCFHDNLLYVIGLHVAFVSKLIYLSDRICQWGIEVFKIRLVCAQSLYHKGRNPPFWGVLSSLMKDSRQFKQCEKRLSKVVTVNLSPCKVANKLQYYKCRE